MSGAPAPFILTAQLPGAMHRWATQLRTQHFPPERNHLEAHVTLFHALPPSCEDELRRALKDVAASESPPPARLEGLMPLGGGTALKISSPAMIEIWARLADRFHGLLTPQDGHKPRLHVTIQNKVTSAAAKALQAELEGTIEPRDFVFPGLALYLYRGGPWEFVRDFRFRG